MSELMCAKTIFEQTGWDRGANSPFKICQELDILLKVYEYDFDLRNDYFREYLENRGILSFKFVENEGTLDYHIELLQEWTEEKFIKNYRNDREADSVDIKIWKLTKAKIQDCWEIFNNPERIEYDKKKKEEEWSNGEVF